MAALRLSRAGLPTAFPALRVALAALLAAAGTMHGILTPDHLAQSTAVGLGFAGAAIFQIGSGALVLARPSTLVYVAVVAGTVGLIALYVLSVTVGLPLHSVEVHHGAPAAAVAQAHAGEAGHHAESGSELGHHADSDSEVRHHADAGSAASLFDAASLEDGAGGAREPVDAAGVATQAAQLAAIAIAMSLLGRSAATRPHFSVG